MPQPLKFAIKSYQKGLKSLLDQSLQTPKQQAWLHKSIGNDFRIEYKPGKDNVTTDALSRVFFMAWSEPQFQLIDKLKREMLHDEQTQVIMNDCQNAQLPDYPYKVKDGLLFWKGGHVVIGRTVARISAQFYWPKLRQDVKEFVRTCTIC